MRRAAAKKQMEEPIEAKAKRNAEEEAKRAQVGQDNLGKTKRRDVGQSRRQNN
jgi:hypothetical protein